MNENLITNFVEKLIQETLDQTREWFPLLPIQEEENPALFSMLFECEFHRVRYDCSYFLPFAAGAVFLISEISESGRDGTVFDGLNLYVQPSLEHDLTLVMRDSVELYRLSNTISDSLKLPDDVVTFIQNLIDS